MVSKKQRKSSRLYNCVIRRSSHALSNTNLKSMWKQDLDTRRRAANARAEMQKAQPIAALPAISLMRRREEKVQKQKVLSFIPRSARAIINVFKKAVS